ncbi:MAG: 16S rRNA (cytidine(1402)-2'-O)-methyltransferase [Myxococcota bacterium]
MTSPSSPNPGKLYVVPTPIGNLDDITLRTLKILKKIKYIACEDTRRTRILLSHFDLPDKTLISCFKENEFQRKKELRSLLEKGNNLALLSDAGTPGISDPGNLIVQEALATGAKVIPLPGASAVTTAISVAGLDASRFVFLGFIGKKGKERKNDLIYIANNRYSSVVYESPHRLQKTLAALLEYCGSQRKITIGREITKIHEEFVRGTMEEVNEYFYANLIKGEFTLVIAPSNREIPPILPPLEKEISRLKNLGLSSKDISKILSEYYNNSSRFIYNLTLKS